MPRRRWGEYDYEEGKKRREEGTLPFMDVKVKGREGMGEVKVKLQGLGLEGMEISEVSDVRERMEAKGEVVGVFPDGSPAIVVGKGGRTLYLGWRFFLPYSFGNKEKEKDIKRKLFTAFLRKANILE